VDNLIHQVRLAHVSGLATDVGTVGGVAVVVAPEHTPGARAGKARRAPTYTPLAAVTRP
jgi:hypothetical protein